MTCKEFWNQTPDGVEMSPESAQHLSGCAECTAKSMAHHTLSTALKSLAEDSRAQEAPSRVEIGLRAAFRAQHGFRPVRRQARPIRIARPAWLAPVAAWAVAAVLMIVLGTTLVRGWHPQQQSGDQGVNPARTLQRAVPLVASVQPAEEEDGMAALGEGFVRLPNAARISVDELMDVVRVEVPASAIIAMGLSVTEEQSARTLVADVALGRDGLARAVRLVTDGGTF